MSASTSSPSVHLHPISPSSSHSSTDSAPHSEPTSDEQPDLGAFTTVLREWTHLQPPPRIPVQIHSATSSTTPTYQPEQSVIGSDVRVRSGPSRFSNSNRSRFSDVSSFTRPPSSSVHPEGSTVWNQALIASYLASTPSNDVLSEREEEEEEEEEYTPSPPNSLVSTALTVEIASETDYPSYDESSHEAHPNASPYNGVFLAIPVGSDGQRLDSRETAHRDDEVEGISSTRDYVDSQITSMQLQSQARVPTSMSGSLSIPTVQTGLPSTISLSNTDHAPASNPSTSTSTLITALLNRSRNPVPPRTTSDSSYTTTDSAASSSNLSLLSYQIPETPPIEEEEEDEQVVTQPPVTHFSSSGHSISNPSTSMSSGSGSLSFKSQRSITSHSSTASASTSTLATQRQPLSQSQPTQPRLQPQPQTQHKQPPLRSSLASSVFSNESPLFNPHSPLPGPQSAQRHSQHPLNVGLTSIGFGVVDDLGTPDQPPSETLLYEASATTKQKQRDMLMEFIPVDDLDVEDEVDNSFGRNTQSLGYYSGNQRTNIGTSSLGGPSSSSSTFERQPPTTDIYSQSQSRAQPPRIQSESAYVDDRVADGQGQDEEDHYPYRYSYENAYKSYSQAMTPKGIPRTDNRAPPSQLHPQAEDVLRQLETSTATTVPQSQGYAPTGKHDHFAYHDQESSSAQRTSTQLHSQHDSIAQPMTTSTNEALPPLSHELATHTQQQQQQQLTSQPQSLPPSHPSSSYPFSVQQQSYGMLDPSNTRRLPPAPASSSTHNNNHNNINTISAYSSPYSQTQTQTSVSISKQREMYQELSHPQPQHRYPHSLLGLHALPASFVSPPAQDLPVPDLDATTSASASVLEAQSISLSGTAPVSIPATTARDKGKSKDAPGMAGTTSTSGDDPRPLIVETDFGEPEPSDEQLRSGVASHLPTAYDSRPGLLSHGHEYGQGHGYMSEEEQSLPSLGYLDEALSFIAAERARWSAAREGPSANGSGGGGAGAGGGGGGGGVGDPTDSREVGGGEGGLVRDSEGGNDKAGGSGGGGKNKQVVGSDNEPKRRRRRKRPPRAHATPQVIPAAAAAASSADNTNYSPFPPPPSSAPATTTRTSEGTFDDGFITPFTPGASPRKKKRSTSVAASASSSKRSLLLESPSKSKTKGKPVEKEFLVLPQAPVTILRRPGPANDAGAEVKGRGFSDDEEEDASMLWEGDSDGGGDGGKTPTNALQGRAVDGPSSDGLQPINYTGRRGRRVGRRERERERQRREFMKQEEAGEKDDEDANVGEVGSESDDHDDDGAEPHEDEEREGEGEGEGEEDDEQGETDSLSNLTLLKPPRKNRSRSRRRRGRDRAYIHDMAGISVSGVYKSTPGTPRRLKFDEGDPVDGMEDEAGVQARVEVEAAAGNDSFVSNPTPALGRQAGEKKKRTRSKRVKALTRAKSDPELRLDVEGGASAPVGEESGDVGPRRSRKGKNKAQADDSMDILDMDRSQLQRLIFASSGAGSRLLLANQQRLLNNQNRVPPPPHSKRGRLLNLANQLFQLFPEQHRELGSIISRIEGQGVEAWPPKGHRTLRSNITIDPYGMQGSTASPLRRKKSKKGGHIRTGSEGAGGGESFEFDMESFEAEEQSNNSFRFPGIDEEDENDAEIDPRGLAPKKGDVLIHVFIDHSNILIGLLSHLKRHAPPRKITGRGQPASAVLSKTTTTSVATENLDAMSAFAAVKSTSARPLPVPTTGEAVSSQRQPVPVPKGGKHPIPLPSFATMSRSLPVASVLKSNGTGSGQEGVGANSDGNDNSTSNDNQEESAGPSSLFVGSIKKEKKIQKHLWHSALALILERGRPITRRVVVTSSPLYQPMESMVNLGYELRIFIRVPDLGDGMDRERHRDKGNTAKGAQSSPVAIPGNSLSGKKTHERQVSGSTSTESGSGGAGSGHASGGGGSTVHAYTGMVNNSTAQTKVKYREQGVDELLQLKLHQAIAATDVPPLGSTIVLATGDGNMGQFNEDGFLGPIRLALRRGWRVELYAWEDGLSRAWRREFGAGTEWGRTGMFRVIGMEQFASTLVEAPEWS